VILLLLAAGVLSAALSSWVTVVVRPSRPMPAGARRLLDDAATLFARMRHPTSLDEPDYLSDSTHAAVDRWLDRYKETSP
jgi:hypothetical protein